MKKVNIVKYLDSESTKTEDAIVVESKFKLFVNEEFMYCFTCICANLKEMAVGYLFSEGIISNYEEIQDINIDSAKQSILVEVMTSGFTKPKELTKEGIPPSSNAIYNLFSEFINRSEVHQITGAVHSMAIATDKKIIQQIDDISRHTALDKLLGYCLMNKIDFSGKVLLLTCRVTESIAKKILVSGLKTALSKAAVSDMAIDICKNSNITLVGFIKAKGMNIYTGGNEIS